MSVPIDLSELRAKTLGDCAHCGRPVFISQNFTRTQGRVAHLRCPITARAFSPVSSQRPSDTSGAQRWTR